MDLMNILCQFNLIVSVIIFGVNIAIASALAKLSKKTVILISVGYALVIFILSILSGLFSQQLLELIGENAQIIYLIISVFLIITGIDTISDWREHAQNTRKSIKLSILAPIPCFVLITIQSALSITTSLSHEIIKFYFLVSLMLLLIILVGYFIIKHTKAKHEPYQITLGNYMTYDGIYFLIEALLLPNLSSLGDKQFQQISVVPESIVIMIILTIILLVIGLIVGKKGNILN